MIDPKNSRVKKIDSENLNCKKISNSKVNSKTSIPKMSIPRIPYS
jgi:hypothetical protein